MDFEQKKTLFETFGTVEYLGANGDDDTRVIIAIYGFSSTIIDINNYNSTISTEILPTYSEIEEFSIHNNILKAVYKKA